MISNHKQDKLSQIMSLLRSAYGESQIKREGALKTLVRTILSQNTNDENRDKAMNSLLAEYDSFSEIIETPQSKLKQVIAVAGLNHRKSKALQGSLSQIKEERGKLDPELGFLSDMSAQEAEDWLRDLYGVGPKTARIVLLFEFNQPVFPVDTHCSRVLKRTGYASNKPTAEKIGNHVQKELKGENMIELHLNLIKHGREICKAQGPLCNQCSLLKVCDFGQSKAKNS